MTKKSKIPNSIKYRSFNHMLIHIIDVVEIIYRSTREHKIVQSKTEPIKIKIEDKFKTKLENIFCIKIERTWERKERLLKEYISSNVDYINAVIKYNEDNLERIEYEKKLEEDHCKEKEISDNVKIIITYLIFGLIIYLLFKGYISNGLI